VYATYNASLAIKYGCSCLPNPFVTYRSTGCHTYPRPDWLTIKSNSHESIYIIKKEGLVLSKKLLLFLILEDADMKSNESFSRIRYYYYVVYPSDKIIIFLTIIRFLIKIFLQYLKSVFIWLHFIHPLSFTWFPVIISCPNESINSHEGMLKMSKLTHSLIIAINPYCQDLLELISGKK